MVDIRCLCGKQPSCCTLRPFPEFRHCRNFPDRAQHRDCSAARQGRGEWRLDHWDHEFRQTVRWPGNAVSLVVPAMLDHAISVNTYSTLLIAASALASSATTGFSSVASLFASHRKGSRAIFRSLAEQMEESSWLKNRRSRITFWRVAAAWEHAMRRGCCGKKERKCPPRR